MSGKKCWEFINCPPEITNRCPAYPDRGEDCWRVDNTLCRGQEQGTAEEKKEFCLFDCGFVKSM